MHASLMIWLSGNEPEPGTLSIHAIINLDSSNVHEAMMYNVAVGNLNSNYYNMRGL